MDFPTLKTGAIAQYPMLRGNRHRSNVLRFADGSEQRFADSARGLHRWTLRLDLLDDSEAKSLDDFFVLIGGRFGTFSFRDPADGAVYPNCSLEQDTLTLLWRGEARIATSVTIRENGD